MAADLVTGLITAPPDVADTLANALVSAKLAACVNVMSSVKSVYRWEGSVETGTESLLIVKTTRSAVAAISKLLEEIHPYEVFEWIVLDIADGNPKYLSWLAGEVKSN